MGRLQNEKFQFYSFEERSKMKTFFGKLTDWKSLAKYWIVFRLNCKIVL